MDIKKNILMGLLAMGKKGFWEASAPAPGGMTYDEALSRINKLRAGLPIFEKIIKIMSHMPEEVKKNEIALGGINTFHFRPKDHSGKTILYIHGGAWIYGAIYSYHLFCAHLAEATHADVNLIEYRLCPENPFPDPLDDCFTAYKALLDQGYPPEEITLSGDSAGGNIALGLLLKLKMEKVPLPGAVVLISPLTNMNLPYKSFSMLQDVDPVLAVQNRAIVDFCYAREESLDNPLISPVLGDLSGLPPMLILVGGKEMLLDDSVMFAKAAKEAGVSVTLDLVDHMFHSYPVFYDILDEAKVAMGKMALFIKEHT